MWELKRVPPRIDWPPEAWPGSAVPFLSSFDPSEWTVGSFGLVPHWADPRLVRSTYNARSETVAQKPSYRTAWRNKQLCAIPVLAFYEPNYETGHAVRWRIERRDGMPFALAGIWERRLGDEGITRWPCSMLTINADEHPLMRQFHKPGDEKRSVVILDAADVDGWLQARSDADARAYLQPFDPEVMHAVPEPLPKKSPA